MSSRAMRALGPAILVAAALLAALWALAYGGGTAPLPLGDPGPVVRWGLPVATLFVDLAAAGLCGTLVTALFALRAGERPFEIAMVTASVSAAVFTLASALTGFYTFMATLNPTFTLADVLGRQLSAWTVGTELGRTWLITTLAGAVITLAAFAVRGWTSTLVLAAVSLAALVPMGTQGYTGAPSVDGIAVTALILHMVGAAVWLGGLILMVLIRPTLRHDAMADVLGRYSSVALGMFLLVAGTGIVRAAADLGSPRGILSPYGVLLAVKVCTLLALGGFGAAYRLRLIDGLRRRGPSRRFWVFAAAELAMMGVASGAAVALARTPAPARASLPAVQTPAEILTGSPLPPALSPMRWLTGWDVDLLWAVVCVGMLFCYLAGVRRLRRRGDPWPPARTTSWVLGVLLLFWATCGPLNAYGDYLFSMDVAGHLVLLVLAPALLVAGAPAVLVLRAVATRRDGSRGVREWTRAAARTRFARLLTRPVVAALLFGVLPWAFFLTDWLRWSLYDPLGHEIAVACFVLCGMLFFTTQLGADAGRRPRLPRVVLLVAAMASQAAFGVTVAADRGLLVAEWFGSMGRTWGVPPLADQAVGGVLAWSAGELPLAVVAVVVVLRRLRSLRRDGAGAARPPRPRRAAVPLQDAELVAYNARLAALTGRAGRDASVDGAGPAPERGPGRADDGRDAPRD